MSPDILERGEIMLDSSSLAVLHSENNKALLEFILARFDVYISMLSVYEFLSSVAYYRLHNIESLLKNLEKVYHITHLNDSIILKASEIDAALAHTGVFLDQIDILVASTAIVNNFLLVTQRSEEFECLKKYGLLFINLSNFLNKIKNYLRTYFDGGSTRKF